MIMQSCLQVMFKGMKIRGQRAGGQLHHVWLEKKKVAQRCVSCIAASSFCSKDVLRLVLWASFDA